MVKKRKEKMINDAMLGLNLFMHRCQQPFFTKT